MGAVLKYSICTSSVNEYLVGRHSEHCRFPSIHSLILIYTSLNSSKQEEEIDILHLCLKKFITAVRQGYIEAGLLAKL